MPLTLSMHIVDAFTVDDQPFTGNPAAVCLLPFDDDLSDEQKQKIASQMNLSETAFVAKARTRGERIDDNRFTLRWFTPTTEVELCGHATLASTRVVVDVYFKDSAKSQKILFDTKFKGTVEAVSSGNLFTISFPTNDCQPLDKNSKGIRDVIRQTLGPNLDDTIVEEIEYSKATKKLLLRLTDVSEPEAQIRQISPNFGELHKIDTNGVVRGVIVTSRGKDHHFLSRYFTPWNGINEDPVTGAAHTVLVPYWKRQLEASGVPTEELIAKQCSRRGGILICKTVGDRVHLSGTTRTFLAGSVRV